MNLIEFDLKYLINLSRSFGLYLYFWEKIILWTKGRKFKRISWKFRTNFSIFVKNFNKNVREMNENFCFRSHFRWMNEIFAKEIERKFGNLKTCVGWEGEPRTFTLIIYFKTGFLDSVIMIPPRCYQWTINVVRKPSHQKLFRWLIIIDDRWSMIDDKW